MLKVLLDVGNTTLLYKSMLFSSLWNQPSSVNQSTFFMTNFYDIIYDERLGYNVRYATGKRQARGKRKVKKQKASGHGHGPDVVFVIQGISRSSSRPPQLRADPFSPPHACQYASCSLSTRARTSIMSSYRKKKQKAFTSITPFTHHHILDR